MSNFPKEISPEIRRFILTSIQSVPHLEAMLLLRANPEFDWDSIAMAHRLFISEEKARGLLRDLVGAGFAYAKTSAIYCYEPSSPKLRQLVEELSEVYYKNLIEVTNLIHSKINRQAQNFGDAFKWNEE